VTTVAEHMAMLESSQLVERKERPGHKWVYYKLTKKADDILHPRDYYKFVLILTTVLVVFGGMFVVSGSAMPGDPLYGFKRSVEGAKLAVASAQGNSTQRAMVQLDIADNRLSEAKDASSKGNGAAMRKAAEEYKQALRDAKDDIESVKKKGRDVSPAIEEADESTSRHITTLENMQKKGHGADADIASALDYVKNVHEEMDAQMGMQGP
jgi:hypothetical protein